jgi:hypothetical protein
MSWSPGSSPHRLCPRRPAVTLTPKLNRSLRSPSTWGVSEDRSESRGGSCRPPSERPFEVLQYGWTASRLGVDVSWYPSTPATRPRPADLRSERDRGSAIGPWCGRTAHLGQSICNGRGRNPPTTPASAFVVHRSGEGQPGCSRQPIGTGGGTAGGAERHATGRRLDGPAGGSVPGGRHREPRCDKWPHHPDLGSWPPWGDPVRTRG